MQYDEKIRLLKSLRILAQIPERQLAALAEFLRPKELEDDAFVFEEGSIGMSLYFVSSGRIRISKRIADKTHKDLAIVGPGEFFGENALTAETPRSASAIASGKCLLFELFRGDLGRWVKLHPQQAVQFFAELVTLQSKRLRRTSSELTLHLDVDDLLAGRGRSAKEFLDQVLGRVIPHLEGAWSGAAYIDSPGGPAQLVASHGECRFDDMAGKLPPQAGAASVWLDDSTVHVGLPGKAGSLGRLVFRAQKPVAKDEREEVGRELDGLWRLIATGLEGCGPAAA